mmetsp:Transcript_33719/g.66329  ORF Transcript_33719/g.66329 Transcript_33719/m.66329 type:complete len:109 (+) Transcript_33719:125-451(+)
MRSTLAALVTRAHAPLLLLLSPLLFFLHHLFSASGGASVESTVVVARVLVIAACQCARRDQLTCCRHLQLQWCAFGDHGILRKALAEANASKPSDWKLHQNKEGIQKL